MVKFHLLLQEKMMTKSLVLYLIKTLLLISRRSSVGDGPEDDYLPEAKNVGFGNCKKEKCNI